MTNTQETVNSILIDGIDYSEKNKTVDFGI